MNDQAISSREAKWLFVTCFISLIATSFAFGTRTFFLADLKGEFNLSDTQFGEIIGAGLWPFAISIVLFSLVIDRFGYKKALVFAFVCHAVSAVVTITATGYWGLYAGAFICALANGTVEAVINPVVATMYPKAKTKWLTILHAGWPLGLVIGGLLAIGVGEGGLLNGMFPEENIWKWQVALLLIPTVIYGVMMIPSKFPVNERVAAGVPYRAMLKDVGALGCLIITGLIVWELTRVAQGSGWTSLNDDALLWLRIGLTAGITIGFTAYARSLGAPIFVLLTAMMIPLATTELGTDGWIKELMTPAMKSIFNADGGWVLIYTATLMMILRFCVGPIVKLLTPLGVLMVSSLFAAAGIYGLSIADTAIVIFIVATIYGIGQTFFWPTTLGVVSERFPEGGAMTINSIAAVGMLGVGIIGGPLLGNLQDQQIDRSLAAQPALYEVVMDPEPQQSVFGEYRKRSADKIEALPEEDQATVETTINEAKSNALAWAAVPPVGLAVCYLLLILYFKARGGYKPVELKSGEPAEAAH
ncbi:MFS transporter [Algisphaera agarilytica]|uniref:MFS family permease n=1 Tax=Algisphaera agarilytica TaxID=1385975 RepID=A0A7X0H8P2_9BACT|nr:MFS transporter [Algisphaera agarilytica]MBB6431303.1 MFS family permease [Algisphaera agarilytica]